MPPIRVYADTSVYGGVFDDEFAEHSRMFFDQADAGRFCLVVSPQVQVELAVAPEQVRAFFERVSVFAEVVDVSDEAGALQRAYLSAAVVTEKSAADALHVALATIGACPVIVSWNFKHIVHREKALAYNAVNALRGLPPLDIRSPREVVIYEQDL